MGIQYVTATSTTVNGAFRTTYTPDGEPQFMGQVVDLYTKYNVRKMSDIWADDFYAVVYTVEQGVFKVYLGSNFELDTDKATATVDASPEVMAAYHAHLEAEAAAKSKAEYEARALRAKEKAIADAKAAAEAPTLGRIVQVVRGRKTPKGTIGVVFWARDGRVGIALSDARDPVTRRNTDVAWLNAEYCVALPKGNSPEECQGRMDKSRAAFKVEPVTPNVAPEQIVVPF